MTAVIMTGGIDLSVGSILALAGMVCGMMMSWNYPIWQAIPCAIVAALFTGLVSGYFIAYVGMPAFVVTLGMMSVARSAAMVLSGNQMVYQFGVDHAKLVAIGGGSTSGWFRIFANLAGPDSASACLFCTSRITSTSPTRRSSSPSLPYSSASRSAGSPGAATFSPSAATSKPPR